ncbi:hypothetical protein L1987_86556 [Smallanthus sonchifolius]|uniref:Uncharacterized protein n=1 Tax=Smallanthus sonchifolius TaxID=185202 RepID=A0ACB8Y3V1_9ASTR|nr:hypothetical protein L1987_86556 [Smallanthus sonchifolius]
MIASSSSCYDCLQERVGECLKTIIHANYPEQWSNLLHRVTHNVQDQQVYGALFVLRIVPRKYEFKSDEERIPVYHVVEETFPHLLNIFSRLVKIGNPSIEIADLIKLIYSGHPSIPVPLEGQPSDLELRRSWGWWKVKKWTVHLLNCHYTGFGDLKLQNPKNKAFAQHSQKKLCWKNSEVSPQLAECNPHW